MTYHACLLRAGTVELSHHGFAVRFRGLSSRRRPSIFRSQPVIDMTQYRQGDVLLVATTDELPTTASPIERDKGRVVLAYGEATGHAHAIYEKGVSLWSVGEGGELLVVDETASLVHEEHDSISIPPGRYFVIHQREYTPPRIASEENVERPRIMASQDVESLVLFDRLPVLRDTRGLTFSESGGMRLLRAETEQGEPVVMVGMLNGLPEADGNNISYGIRVPPHITDAREAAAWTFSMEAQDYAPTIES